MADIKDLMMEAAEEDYASDHFSEDVPMETKRVSTGADSRSINTERRENHYSDEEEEKDSDDEPATEEGSKSDLDMEIQISCYRGNLSSLSKLLSKVDKRAVLRRDQHVSPAPRLQLVTVGVKSF